MIRVLFICRMTDKRKLFKKIFFMGLSSANDVRYSRCKAKKQIKQIIWNEKERQKKTQSN